MRTELTSLSPLSFELLKVGDPLILKRQRPRANEFRSSIGAPIETVLVFRGGTKVGMLPIKFVKKFLNDITGKLRCNVVNVCKEDKLIIVEISQLNPG
jgi:hypothetical protein